MSMHRQIWLAIVMSALVAFGGGLICSVFNAKVYLESQLTQKNIDNANSLALTITHIKPTQANAETAVNAMFDTGHYEFIQIKDHRNRVVVERHDDDQKLSFQYLQKIVHLQPQIGVAEINDGWKQFGTVYISSNVHFAYQTLHSTITHSLLAMLAAGLLSALLSYLILNRITKPINDVINQVAELSQKRFFTIPETKIPELNKLAKTMNSTVHRLKDAFNHEEQKLEAMRKKACSDSLTGIANRGFFTSVLETVLQKDHLKDGTLLLVRISDLGDINDEIGRQKCDELIKALANTLNSYTIGFDDAIAGRLNGSDFAVLILNQGEKNKDIHQAISENLFKTAKRWIEPEQYIFTGSTQFKTKSTMSEILAKADKMLTEAQEKRKR
jgi:diguanylate cyclase (GGDEF)-like protein